MPLSFSTRRVGDIIVVTCTGRIVVGDETAALETQLDALIPVYRQVLLHLGGVDFIDSCGLGLLVRYTTRAQNAAGAFRICAVSPAIDHVLRVSRLKPVLQPYDTEAHAIADAHRDETPGAGVDVLCVDESTDVLAYLRGVLREAGYRPITAANLPDALILFSARRPGVVVVGASLRQVTGTRSADEFRRLTSAVTVVDLPAGFARQEAADAAEHLLSAIRATART